MRPRSVFDDLSFAVTVGIAAYLTASRFDRGIPVKNGEDYRTQRSRKASETYRSKRVSAARWRSILRQTYAGIRADRILSVAAGVTFYGLLALFPTIAAVVSIYGLMADSQFLTELLADVGGALPTAGVEFLRNRIERSGTEASLSFALLISILTALWSANRGMKALFEGLNVAYGEIESRTTLQLNTTSIIFTIGLLLFLLISILGVAAVPLVFDFDNLDTTGSILLWVGRWPVLFMILLMCLAILYRFGPSRKDPHWRWISPGSLLASSAWLIGSFLFSTFLAHFGDYNRTFGTLAAVDTLLLWMWLSSINILIGAEFDAEYER
ncbi:MULTISPECIES: YihY/virulence factor BrkB family protein [unclassified Sinorhizobium]|uniref:YihY/virulence factor BrkB family protein n=1 Tax=unclassified Sinorhizobium TaxID=2613772 RepID=UPI0035266D23